ncbi:MAG TPA: hypothetical protein VHU80_22490, partial [Polyangiaceae bacterium]|nr:hypothetical protein [Polyangiaceae bacterium]
AFHFPPVHTSCPWPPSMQGSQHCPIVPSQAAPLGHAPFIDGVAASLPGVVAPPGPRHTDAAELHPGTGAHVAPEESAEQSVRSEHGFVHTLHSHERPPQSASLRH